jgi:hypothetical protein
VFAYLRKKENKELIVILNLCDHLVRFDILSSWIGGKFNEVFSNTEYDFSTNRNFEMKGWEYLVYVKE